MGRLPNLIQMELERARSSNEARENGAKTSCTFFCTSLEGAKLHFLQLNSIREGQTIFHTHAAGIRGQPGELRIRGYTSIIRTKSEP